MKKLTALILGVALAGPAHASRNSSGTYSLVSGNPVTSGTTISSTWANNTLSDIATALTNSLDRTGNGAMQAPLRLTDGTYLLPALAFSNETGSGIWRAGANDLRLSVGGAAAKWGWTAAGPRLIDTSSGASAYGITLAAPSGMAASYTVTLPAAAPASTLPMSMSSAGAITAAQITRPGLPTVGQQVSSSSGSFTTTSGTLVDVTNLSVTITTTGRPVMLILQPVAGTTQAAIGVSRTGASPADGFLAFDRDGSSIASVELNSVSTGSTGAAWRGPPGGMVYLDPAPTAASHTYKLQASAVAGSVLVTDCVLVAYEL